MKCQNVELLLSDYLDGELPPPQVERVHAHLGRCHACSTKWRALRQTLRLVAHYGRETCPVDLRGSIVAAVADRRPAPRWRISWGRPAAWSGAVAGMACAVLAVTLWRFAPVPRPVAALPDPEAPVVAEARLHDQYELTTVLGTTDGLVLSLPAACDTTPADLRQVAR